MYDKLWNKDNKKQYNKTISNKKLIPTDKKIPKWAKAAAGFAAGYAIGGILT